MLKNVKIAPEAHRALSIRASEIGAMRGELCTALVYAALDKLDAATIDEYLQKAAAEHAKTGYQNPDQ